MINSIKLRDKEIGLSAEKLLMVFNRNISKNTALLDYIGRNNLFEIIGKARNEGVHSRFVSELLAGSFFNEDSRESTLHHFLDLLLYRAEKENKAAEINEALRKAILSRSVFFKNEGCVCELPVKDYQKKYNVNKGKRIDKGDRIDIYLRYQLENKVDRRDTLEVFIENKVDSSESDNKTARYHEACDNGGGIRPFQLFVYLTPHPVRDMDQYYSLDNKPVCPNYIHICYQDLIDYVIEPLLADYSVDAEKKAKLLEYVSCLELPAMPDKDSSVSSKELSIMAVSSKEKELVHLFMDDAINRRTINKAIEVKLSKPQYTVETCGRLLNSNEALQSALRLIINVVEEPLEVLKRVAACNVVGPQHGSSPFLIYSPKHWRTQDDSFCKYLPYDNLFVHNGKVYPSLNSAIVPAIQSYKEKFNKTAGELVQDFHGVYSAKGSGIPLVSLGKDKNNKKVGDVFVRKDIKPDRLPAINAILGQELSVTPIDNESYLALMQCNVQLVSNCPVTENPLPQEIDDLVESAFGKSNYEQVGTTGFFYRKDVSGDRILKLNALDVFNDGEDLVSKDADTSLLKDFFKSRRNLILSVYKLLLEESTENYKDKLTIYHKMLQI